LNFAVKRAAPAAEPAPALVASVNDLKVHFRSKRGVVHAVDGISFDIRDGETFGLVGETGCGKSVTARAFLRLVPVPPGVYAGGSIMFRPRHHDRTSGDETIDLLTISEAKMRTLRGNRIAMIFQDPGKALNPALSIREQIAEVFYQHRTVEVLDLAGVDRTSLDPASLLLRRQAAQQSRGIERALLALPPLRSRRDRIAAAVDDRIAAALAETQIPNPRKIMDRYPHELSGGMRQRVMIAQALACNPDLLIADEPTTALDVTVQARILELIAELKQRHKTSVLYISHDLSLVRRICDRVAVMYAGRIAEISTPQRIFEAPSHPYTRGLLGAVPSAAHARGKLAAIEGTVPELVDPSPSCRFAGRCPHEVTLCSATDPLLRPLAADHEVACFIHHPPVAGSGKRPSFAERIR
jgi:oligopeptide/dipeptide ABC transporter ATP-binding protein